MWIGLLIVLGLLILYAVADWIHCMIGFRKNRFTFRDDRVKETCRMVVLSDLHGRAFGKNSEKLIRSIEEESPDAVLITGDMITATKDCDYEVALSVCEQLARKYPVYYALGNHEQKWKERTARFGNVYQEYEKKLKNVGVRILENEHVLLQKFGVVIYGVCVEHDTYYKRLTDVPMEVNYMESLLGKPEDGLYHVLLAHNPDYFPFYAAWGADLTLSGHVHGGIVNFPGLGGFIAPSLKLFPKYDAGLFKEGKAQMILSRGLGTHTLPVRVWNPAELICVELTPEKK